MRQTFLAVLLAGAALISAASASANPITNLIYTADPSAHVFDGRLYVYPSHDNPGGKKWNLQNYHVFSTDDMRNWTDHGQVLDVKDIPWPQKTCGLRILPAGTGNTFSISRRWKRARAEARAA